MLYQSDRLGHVLCGITFISILNYHGDVISKKTTPNFQHGTWMLSRLIKLRFGELVAES